MLAIKYKDGVMMAADTLGAHSDPAPGDHRRSPSLRSRGPPWSFPMPSSLRVCLPALRVATLPTAAAPRLTSYGDAAARVLRQHEEVQECGEDPGGGREHGHWGKRGDL